MSGVLDLLPHDMGLRVELDTNETYWIARKTARQYERMQADDPFMESKETK